MVKIRVAAAFVLVLGLMVFKVGVAQDYKQGGIGSEKLIGVWRVVKSTDLPPGASIEMTKENKIMLVIPIKDNKSLAIHGTWAVKGLDLNVSMTTPDGRDQKQTLKIVELSDVKLITKDERGVLDEFKKDLIKLPK